LLRCCFAGSLSLYYIPLIGGFARHVFELKLSQLLKLPDLLGSQLTRQVDRVVPVQEIGGTQRPQHSQDALLRSEQFALHSDASQYALRGRETGLRPPGVFTLIGAGPGWQAGNLLVARESGAKHYILPAERIGERLPALHYVR
jgi:hypothetical protein